MSNWCLGCHREIRDGDYCSLCRLLKDDPEREQQAADQGIDYEGPPLTEDQSKKDQDDLNHNDDDIPF